MWAGHQRDQRVNYKRPIGWQVANHPDLVTAEFEKDNLEYPPAEQLIAECGKMALLDRLLTQLHAKGHKVGSCVVVLQVGGLDTA